MIHGVGVAAAVMIAGRGPLLRIWVPQRCANEPQTYPKQPGGQDKRRYDGDEGAQQQIVLGGEAVLFHEIAAAVDDQRQQRGIENPK